MTDGRTGPAGTRPQVRVGTSGWVYAGWRGDFYPRGLVQRRELEHLATRMRTVELNGSFYSLQRPERYRAWAAATPEDFVFAVKGGRFITHLKKLVGVDTALANFLASGVLALGHRLGPLLWQLPERLAYDRSRLEPFLDLLPRSTTEAAALAARHDEKVEGRAWTTTDADRPLRHALEVRHRSFLDPEPLALLRAHGVALVVADTAGRWPFADERTADFAYARLHGDTELYTSGYSPQALEQWAERVRRWADDGRDVYVYLDNDAKGFAPHDAVALADLLGAGPRQPAQAGG
ncbi:DUF72 domain-containing protein [Thalassiella azotivora]